MVPRSVSESLASRQRANTRLAAEAERHSQSGGPDARRSGLPLTYALEIGGMTSVVPTRSS
jgi:hypothetical protein